MAVLPFLNRFVKSDANQEKRATIRIELGEFGDGSFSMPVTLLEVDESLVKKDIDDKNKQLPYVVLEGNGGNDSLWVPILDKSNSKSKGEFGTVMFHEISSLVESCRDEFNMCKHAYIVKVRGSDRAGYCASYEKMHVAC